MQNTLVIGDIHGCFWELQALLDKAGLRAEDRVLGIGDVVDRGPETPEVVDFFRSTPNASVIMGNHERKHMRAARHEVKLALSQEISQAQLGAGYPAALAWMSGLPIFIELAEAIVVHGYFEPGVALDCQNPSVLCGTMGGDHILRQRYTRPWYELYNGGKPVIVGHDNYTHTAQPFVYRDLVYGLDTDCVTGKALTGILLPAFQFVSVPSRGNLWQQVRRPYLEHKITPAAPRVSHMGAWTEAQNEELARLLLALQAANRQVMAQVEAGPGYAELSVRQQAKRYTEVVGDGLAANLLHLTRLGKLDVDLLRKLVRDPGLLRGLIDSVEDFTNGANYLAFA